MPDAIRKVDYFKAEVANKAGEGARILGVLRDAGINLLAFSGFPRGRKAQLDFVPEDAAAFRKAARKAGLVLAGRKAAFLVAGEDRAGAIAEIAARLGAAGINITAVDAVAAGAGRYGAIVWVKPQDVARAARILGAR